MEVDLIIFGFASVYCFHIEGMPQDKGDTLPATEVSYAVPGEHALDSYDNVFPEGLYSIEKDLGAGINVPVQSDLPGFIQDTEIHFSGMKIDSAIKFVLFGVESHTASSSGLKCDFIKRRFIMPQEEALNSVNCYNLTALLSRFVLFDSLTHAQTAPVLRAAG